MIPKHIQIHFIYSTSALILQSVWMCWPEIKKTRGLPRQAKGAVTSTSRNHRIPTGRFIFVTSKRSELMANVQRGNQQGDTIDEQNIPTLDQLFLPPPRNFKGLRRVDKRNRPSFQHDMSRTSCLTLTIWERKYHAD